MAINPNTQSYISDLLHDNQVSFATIESYKLRIKDLYSKRTTAENDNNIVLAQHYTILICSYKRFIKEEHKNIAINLEKVRGLRNGTIKEI